eukprot:12359922-Prorocentrum_lima.AAC.1
MAAYIWGHALKPRWIALLSRPADISVAMMQRILGLYSVGMDAMLEIHFITDAGPTIAHTKNWTASAHPV